MPKRTLPLAGALAVLALAVLAVAGHPPEARSSHIRHAVTLTALPPAAGRSGQHAASRGRLNSRISLPAADQGTNGVIQTVKPLHPTAQRRGATPAVNAAGDWGALVRSLPWPANTILRIIGCESGGRPNAYNPSSGATGLLQILHGPFDPIANIRLGFQMWLQRGVQPWQSSKSCWSA